MPCDTVNKGQGEARGNNLLLFHFSIDLCSLLQRCQAGSDLHFNNKRVKFLLFGGWGGCLAAWEGPVSIFVKIWHVDGGMWMLTYTNTAF